MTQSLEQAMQAFQPGLPLGVAFSGGADSTALLVACAAKWPGQVVAFHVNHGLQDAAAAFEQRCRDLCAQLNVPLRVLQVDAGHQPGQSPEDAARTARYKAFDALARMEYAQPAIKYVAIAQHADDQIETLVLALSRGAGLPGLSAMPAQWQRDGIAYFRPLLRVPGADIRQWLADRQVTFVEDPSNADERFTRNRIRARVLPALESAFPQFRDTFARSAAHAAQAQAVLEEVAAQDLLAMVKPGGSDPAIKSLQTLSQPRQANVLRYWLRQSHGVSASTAQLQELQAQIACCTSRGHRIHIKVGQGFVQRSAAVLTWYNPRVLLTTS